MTPKISIVMPAFGSGPALRRALAAVAPSIQAGHELIVVDDATPGGLVEPLPVGARLIVRASNGGPGAARNDGVAVATHDVVLFVDADVEVRPDTVSRIADLMSAPNAPDALFGSYDDDPAEKSIVSHYRNLLHHWVHQHGQREASTFWAGCGAIQVAAFRRAHGFDIATFVKPSVEDIDLGYRMRGLGFRIELDPTILVKHLKKWTLIETVRVDVFRRAIPWTRLMAAQPSMTSDLNVKGSQRLSGVLASLGLLLVAIAPLNLSARVDAPVILGSALACFCAVAALNAGFLGFLGRRGGMALLFGGYLLLVLYFLYSTFAFAIAKIALGLGWMRPLGNRDHRAPELGVASHRPRSDS